ncbi:MAG: DUF1592 domain-containing protein [Planctomycetes bacterium]|nr:DUF1592 domain-containing protein [Planctomycetota bacterium]
MSSAAEEAPSPQMSPADALGFLRTYCLECHQGKEAESKLDLARFDSAEKIAAEAAVWNKVLRRVRDGEMPPEDAESPARSEREAFVAWISRTLHEAACSDGVSPGPAPLRRLNRTEYAATLRDLLDIHVDAGQALPADGAGGEGFDNAAETLFISPIHAEKYLEAARTALGYAFSDTRSRQRFLTAEPKEGIAPEDAAHQVLIDFLPRAFRRPTNNEEIDKYLALFQAARQRDPSFEVAMQFALEAVLISPQFLFRIEEPNTDPEPRLLSDYELATRLSYFLWASMPDDELFGLAKEGKLNDPNVLGEQAVRMLRPERRRDKSREFAQSFVEQWLGTRALGREFKPDASVAPNYDSELEGGMRYEPIMFFQEILAENRSLLSFLDSDFTYANRRLARHYGIKGEFREQPRHTELPEDGHRGGLLGMAGVLAVSSYPHRTSPVLRGKWILETILGAPPPPPPPNVPQLDEDQAAVEAKTLRERLEQHRRNPTCAACHNRIDPLGFGLENYDVLGQWRTEQAGKPIDGRGELPDGTVFDGPDELKQLLLARKDQFVRHLTAKLLGYALGRGLTNEDYCTVDEIVDQLKNDNYAAHTLVLGIVRSVPFRYKVGTDPTPPSPGTPGEGRGEGAPGSSPLPGKPSP